MNGTTFEEMREALEKSQKIYGEQRERTKEARDRAARHEVTIADLRAELAALREPESVVSPDRDLISRKALLEKLTARRESWTGSNAQLSGLDAAIRIVRVGCPPAAPASLDDRIRAAIEYLESDHDLDTRQEVVAKAHAILSTSLDDRVEKLEWVNETAQRIYHEIEVVRTSIQAGVKSGVPFYEGYDAALVQVLHNIETLGVLSSPTSVGGAE